MTVRLSGALLLYVSDGGQVAPRVIAALAEMDLQILYGRGGGKSTAFDMVEPVAVSNTPAYIVLDEIESIPFRRMIDTVRVMDHKHGVAELRETKQQRVARLRGTRW